MEVDAVNVRTLELLCSGMGTTGPSRLGIKPTRRTFWSAPERQAEIALSSNAPQPPSKQKKSNKRPTKRRKPKNRSKDVRDPVTIAAPSVTTPLRLSGPAELTKTPLARRRNLAAASIKVDQTPADLPKFRETFIDSEIEKVRRHESTDFLSARVTRPARSPPQSPLKFSPPSSPRAVTASQIDLKRHIKELIAQRRARPLSGQAREASDAAIDKARKLLSHERMKQVEQLRRAKIIDTNGDGVIEVNELYNAAKSVFAKPTRPYAGRTAELATPGSRAVNTRRPVSARGVVGEGSYCQYHEEIEGGWVSASSTIPDLYIMISWPWCFDWYYFVVFGASTGARDGT